MLGTRLLSGTRKRPGRHRRCILNALCLHIALFSTLPPFSFYFYLFIFIPPSLFLLKFPPCGCVLLTSHLLWCELHICEWMTGKINSPAPFSLTVGPANE